MNIFCCGCKCLITPTLKLGTQIYPHRYDLANKYFWQCDTCKNYVGCHPKTDKPLGTIPTPDIRNLRGYLHRRIDPLWKDGKITRTKLYAKISKQLGYEYHTGEVSSVQQYQQVLDIVKGIKL